MTAQATNWVAIIGAPSSGKTSVINALEQRGYKVEHEVARAYLEGRLSTGERIEDIRAPGDAVRRMQQDIFAHAIARKKELNPQHLIFFDRGLGDMIFYYTHAGLDPEPVRAACTAFHYRAVFLLERLPLTADGIRTETDDAAQQMQDAFLADYRALGYAVQIIPVMSIEERVDMILERLGPV